MDWVRSASVMAASIADSRAHPELSVPAVALPPPSQKARVGSWVGGAVATMAGSRCTRCPGDGESPTAPGAGATVRVGTSPTALPGTARAPRTFALRKEAEMTEHVTTPKAVAA